MYLIKLGAIHTVAIDTQPLKRANNPYTSESLALNKMAQCTVHSKFQSIK